MGNNWLPLQRGRDLPWARHAVPLQVGLVLLGHQLLKESFKGLLDRLAIDMRDFFE